MIKKIIFILFAFLLFLTPLILWPFTSEVFEFNKTVLMYILTTLISAGWLSKCVTERRIIFRRTILDLPLLIFLGSQIVSTLLSIDFYTSVFGYYSRFNGGLLTTVCYIILYWAFVSNFEKDDTSKLLKYSIFPSAVIVSVYGVLEHFGIDKNLWVQDVQSRVFATLGQPNWLAAWVVAIIPITWSYMLNSNYRKVNFWIYLSLSILFFWVLIFTKSRSGFLGFCIAAVIFWGLVFIQNIKVVKSYLGPSIIVAFSVISICVISGTQWTPSLMSILKSPTIKTPTVASGTVLESGGTESGTIRKIVWQGAVDIWKHYPIFGTGAETFAYSYYLYRPVAHNITSEWDFIYNKAHNEFLNLAANSGTFGILSYLLLIGIIIMLFLRHSKHDRSFINIALLAGFISLSVSNFFGFSVVPTQLEFFLFPAFAIVLVSGEELKVKSEKLASYQKVAIAIVLLFASYFLLLTYRYWYADILYSKAKAENGIKRPDLAYKLLTDAINIEPKQAIYYGELGTTYSTMAMAFDQEKDASTASKLSKLAMDTISESVNLSPANVNLRRQMFGVYVRLSTIDDKYLNLAGNALAETIKIAPTDPKLYYNLGIVDANLGQTSKAVLDFQKAIELKPNYSDARIQYAALLVHLNKNAEAKTQLEYILNKIDPGNTTAKAALENIK